MEGDGRRHEKNVGMEVGGRGGWRRKSSLPRCVRGGPVRDTTGLRTEDGGALALAAL